RRQRRPEREQSRNRRPYFTQANRNRGGVSGGTQSGTQPRARAQNVKSETLSDRAGQETRRDRPAIWRERRDRMGQPDSFLRFSAVSNGERPPHRRRDEQRPGSHGRQDRHLYPGEIARTKSG